jgi:hypothetical protein
MKIGKFNKIRWKLMFIYLLVLAAGIFIGVNIATYKINAYLINKGAEGIKMVMEFPLGIIIE